MKGAKPMKDVYEYVKSVGKFKHVPRTEGISTTLIEHLVLLKNGKL
jgi:glycerol-3-phosphate cytidylyltransferase-like family protein